MPTVPKYEIGQLQSRGINARQNISVSSDAFGGNVAQAQIGLGKEVSKQSDILFNQQMKIRDEYDKGTLREMDNNYSAHIREKMGEFSQLNGRAASDAKQQYIDGLNKFKKELSKNLDPRLANSWGAMADVRTNNAFNKINTHTVSQTIAYNDTQREARIANQLDEMVDNSRGWVLRDGKLEWPAVQAAKNVGITEIIDQLKDIGIDVNNPKDDGERDIIRKARLDFTSKGHGLVIKNLLAADQGTHAQTYYDANKAEIDPSSHATLEESLKLQTTKKLAQQKTDEIMEMSELTKLEQQAVALKIKDANLRDEVLERVKKRQTDVANDLTRIETEAKDKVDLLISEGKTKDDIDSNLWNAMSDEDEAKANNAITEINKLLREAAEKRETENKKRASEAAYFHLDKLAHENFDLFKTFPLTRFTGLVDKEDLEKLIEKQRKGPHSSNTLSDTDLIKTAMASVKLEWTNLTTPGGEKERNFLNKYEQRVDRFAKLNNRDPNPDEKQNLLFEVAHNMVYVASYAVDKQFVLGTLTPAQEELAYSMVNGERIFHSKIKATDRALIIKTLQELKQPINAQRIAEEFVSLRDKEIDAGEMTREEFLNEYGDTNGNETIWQANNTSIKIKERELEQIQTKSNSLSHTIKIITDTSDMSNAEAIKAIKSHTGNILNKINWQNNPKATRKAKRQNLVDVITPLMQKELDTINEYLASINTESTHEWDLIFGTNVNLSLIASEGGEDGESMTDQYQDFQVETLRKRKQELEDLLQ